MDELKGKIREHRSTYKDCADFIGISVTAFNSKINKKVPFTCWEAKRLIEFLHLTKNEAIRIFLC